MGGVFLFQLQGPLSFGLPLVCAGGAGQERSGQDKAAVAELLGGWLSQSLPSTGSSKRSAFLSKQPRQLISFLINNKSSGAITHAN